MTGKSHSDSTAINHGSDDGVGGSGQFVFTGNDELSVDAADDRRGRAVWSRLEVLETPSSRRPDR